MELNQKNHPDSARLKEQLQTLAIMNRPEVSPAESKYEIDWRTTKTGLWVARVEYSDGAFLIVEGHGNEIDHTRGPLYPKVHRGVGVSQQERDSARRAVAAYREDPKQTEEQRRRLEVQEEFGAEASIDHLLEERET